MEVSVEVAQNSRKNCLKLIVKGNGVDEEPRHKRSAPPLPFYKAWNSEDCVKGFPKPAAKTLMAH